MSDDKKPTSLGNNNIDHTVLGVKIGANLIPLVGGAVAEIIGQLIPGQRLDRIQRYVELLNNSIESLPEKTVKKLLENELFISLVEDSFYQASRALTDERRTYILNIVQNGMTTDELKINDSKYLLRLLSEINDVEVIWLRYYHERTIGHKQAFMHEHQNILQKEMVTLGSNLETRRKGALQENYTVHLEGLGLIQHHLDMQKVVPETTRTRMSLSSQEVNVPNYDNFGKLRISYTETTVLGNMLLEYIGLIDQGDAQA